LRAGANPFSAAGQSSSSRSAFFVVAPPGPPPASSWPCFSHALRWRSSIFGWFFDASAWLIAGSSFAVQPSSSLRAARLNASS